MSLYNRGRGSTYTHMERLGATMGQMDSINELGKMRARAKRSKHKLPPNPIVNLERLAALHTKCSVEGCKLHGIYRVRRDTYLCSKHRLEKV